LVKNTHRFLLFLLSISLFCIVTDVPWASVKADNEAIGFQNVQLWLYPEYDDPRLLVMLEGQIVGAQSPVEVRFMVPSAAELYSAGSMDAQGRYSGGPPHREPSTIPGWDEISYEVVTNTFRVEYYDPIIRGQPDKTISYEFRWLYPISELDVVIQEPRKSSNFSISSMGESFIDSQGFTSYRYNYNDINSETSLHFEITYTKSDLKPSLAIEDNEGSNILLIVGSVIGLCVVFGVGFYWLMRAKRRTKAKVRHSTQGTSVRGSKEERSSRRFCSQCGQRMEGSFRFCPYCGTKQ
jgi:hypothetical protein